jgi:5'-3' exonuclease
MKKETVIVIDSNGLGHRAKHSMTGLSYDEMQTGVMFGFLGEVFRLAKKFETNKFAFAWDSRKNYRKELYSNYKRKRTERVKTPEEQELSEIANEQFTLLRKHVLPYMGFKNVYLKTGYEADDIIANIVMYNSSDYDFIIATADEDMFQLLNKAKIYNLRKKTLYTVKEFTKDYGIPANKWKEVKAIAGCGSDNVEGVKGVGEKTAIKYLKGELKKGVALENIKKSYEVIERNRILVTLPYQHNKMEEIILDFDDEIFSFENFYKVCDEYGFYSFKKNINEWNKIFEME